MNFISAYIQAKVDLGSKTKDIAEELDLTSAMVGQYRLDRGYKPSFTIAKKIYILDGTVLYPFSGDSLKWGIEND